MSNWKISDGGVCRRFDENEAYSDHYAMSGGSVDVILEWKVVPGGGLVTSVRARFPRLRTEPDNTHASLEHVLTTSDFPPVRVNGKPASGKLERVELGGCFLAVLRHPVFEEERRIFPARDGKATVFDYRKITNTSGATLRLDLPLVLNKLSAASGHTLFVATQRVDGGLTLKPGESFRYAVNFSDKLGSGNPEVELRRRLELAECCFSRLALTTPDRDLNAMFKLAKLRAAESVNDTPNGPVHCPGGYNRYLYAIWANDEAEYANPFFPFLGEEKSCAAALNSYLWFAKYLNDDYSPLPGSIICGGTDTWTGAGDRGDAAMIASGAARFALASGDVDTGRGLLPLIDWCIEYCRRRRNGRGVVTSDCDELEKRFPAGDANLSTNSLFLDALLRTADLRRELGMPFKRLLNDSERLKAAIEGFFGATLGGFETYRYYEGCDSLRGWQSLPLVFGLTDRAKGTLDALFSRRMWSASQPGVDACEGAGVYWDRATLYALRAAFIAGDADRAARRLHSYTKSRLLGEHVPYAVEASSEFNASQLSGESALYCRVATEGLLGIVPTGFGSFTLKPSLPEKWRSVKLERMKGFGADWTLEVENMGDGSLTVNAERNGSRIYRKTLPAGSLHRIVTEPPARSR